ncbi:MAG: DUF4831 family protein [Prolixibacteraceae bacterium]
MKTGYTLLFILMIIGSSFAQRTDKKEAPMSGTNGIVYSLPRTGLRIYVKTTQEKFFHGPYYQYAEALLGIKNAPSSDRENWSIDDIRIETFSEPDPAQIHTANGTAAVLVSLTPAGVLAGINAPVVVQDEEANSVSTFLANTNIPEIPFPDLSLNSFFEKRDSTRKGTLMIKPVEEKAMEAASTVTKLRKRRFKSLANGYEEQLPDGRAYEVMTEELGKLEEAYVGLFTGKSFRQTLEYSFDYIPGNNSVSGEVIFRFSEGKGVMPASDLSAKPIVIDIKKLENMAEAQAKQASEPPSVAGVLYRIPGKAEIRILNGINTMASTRLGIAQFGTTAFVPDVLLDGSYSLTFHTGTGSIKSIQKTNQGK